MINLSDSKFRFLVLDFYRYGGRIDNSKLVGEFRDPTSAIFIFVSVPNDTHLVDDTGEKMCGEHLAKYFKEKLLDYFMDPTDEAKTYLSMKMGLSMEEIEELITLPDTRQMMGNRVKVKMKIREQSWDKELEEFSSAAMFLAVTQTIQK